MKRHSRAQVQAMAEAILPGFIPKQADQHSLIFHFTIPPASSYKVEFNKNAEGKWVFKDYFEDDLSKI